MLNKIIPIIVLFVVGVPCLQASPCFDEYAVDVYAGPVANLQVGAESERYLAALQEAMREGVNFSGKYIVFQYSCGGGCVSGGILDAVTGKLAADFPDEFIAGDSPESFVLRYRKNSRLIMFQGRSAYDNAFREEYYQMLDGELKLIP